MRHILSILVENEAGALSRVAGLFSARGDNIESLTVAATEDATMSGMTIGTTGPDDVVGQTTKQPNKPGGVGKGVHTTEDRQTTGKLGEDLATEQLWQQGYAILARRYRSRSGELDVVARDGRTVVFVEVKTRDGCGFGAGSEAVTALKRRRMADVALDYLVRQRLTECPCRFDVVTVEVVQGRERRHFVRNPVIEEATLGGPTLGRPGRWICAAWRLDRPGTRPFSSPRISRGRAAIMKKGTSRVSRISITTLGVASASCSITVGPASTTSRRPPLPARRPSWRLRSSTHLKLPRSSDNSADILATICGKRSKVSSAGWRITASSNRKAAMKMSSASSAAITLGTPIRASLAASGASSIDRNSPATKGRNTTDPIDSPNGRAKISPIPSGSTRAEPTPPPCPARVRGRRSLRCRP